MKDILPLSDGYNFQSRSRAFTLVEVVIAIAIIAILISVAWVAAKTATERARSRASAENLRQIGIASSLYAGAHDDYLPPYLTCSEQTGPLNPDGSHGHQAKAWKEGLFSYGMVDSQFYAPLDPHTRKYGPAVNLDDHLHSSYRHNGTLVKYLSGTVLILSLTGVPEPAGKIHVYENGKDQVRSPRDGRLYDVPYDDKAFEVLYFDGHVKRVPKQY